MIECINLSKYYRDQEVVSSLSFKVNEGEVFGLLGTNGAGKTTTIKMILGLTRVSSGEIKVNNKQYIGYSPETPYFPSFMSAEEIMIFYAKIQKIKEKLIMDEIDKCLKKVRLTSCKKKKVSSYSKGMLQRLAIAQSLLGSPSIIILDEPCAGLDAVGRIEMLALIKELKEEGRTIVLNSHIISDVDRVADRVLIMKDGKKLKEINVKKLSDNERRESLEEKFIKVIGGLEYVGNN